MFDSDSDSDDDLNKIKKKRKSDKERRLADETFSYRSFACYTKAFWMSHHFPRRDSLSENSKNYETLRICSAYVLCIYFTAQNYFKEINFQLLKIHFSIY